MLVLEGLVGLHRTVQLQLLQHYCQAIDLDYHDIEWFALEMNRDHSVIFDKNVFLFSRGSSQLKNRTQVSHIAGRFFTS